MKEQLSKHIPVREFRQILIWPLRLENPESVSIRHSVADLDASPFWQRLDDPLRHLDADRKALSQAAYQEFVYFHPFVQSFLYGPQAAMQVFRRTDIQAASLDLDNHVTGPFRADLAVDRINLYLFEGGNAVLVVEVSCGCVAPGQSYQGLLRDQGKPRVPGLAHILVILERFRRLYPPYWSDDQAGLSPKSVRWIRPVHDDLCFSPLPLADALAHVGTSRHPPLADHWRALLHPLRFSGKADAGHGEIWTHVVDERAPSMAYVAVDDPHAIEAGDWVRLAMLDEPGQGRNPYSPGFLAEFQAQHCYDRFWDDGDRQFNSRYLMSGYGFVAVGSAGNPFFADHVRQHVRRHYFQMGLIAHFQNAALLTLSDRLAHAVDTLRHGSTDQADQILQDVLAFTHRYWFPDISNHVQARELYDRWRRHLDVEALQAQVMTEAQSLNAFVNGRQATRLNKIAVAGVVPAVVTGALGMNVVVQNGAAYLTKRFGPPANTQAEVQQVQPTPAETAPSLGEWAVLAGAGVLGFLVWRWARRYTR